MTKSAPGMVLFDKNVLPDLYSGNQVHVGKGGRVLRMIVISSQLCANFRNNDHQSNAVKSHFDPHAM